MSCTTRLSRAARPSRGAGPSLNVRWSGLAVSGGSRGSETRPRGLTFWPRFPLGPGFPLGPCRPCSPWTGSAGESQQEAATSALGSALVDSPVAQRNRGNQDHPESRRSRVSSVRTSPEGGLRCEDSPSRPPSPLGRTRLFRPDPENRRD